MTAYQKLYTGIGRAAWGYFFIYFDFNINTVSILPSFIGYMLFLSAINCLCEEERELNLLRTLGVILTVWHVASWLASWGSIDLDGMLQVVDIIIGVVNDCCRDRRKHFHCCGRTKCKYTRHAGY